MLQRGGSLDEKHVDHPLAGNGQGFRDCHVKPDLVLIYRVSGAVLQLARIGSHSELF
ncbi:type II toxin-antitoxin system YafQ family toxin [Marinobacter xiaoshiensis]|uniref:Type II toxin-antitoxin system YafQ family toxin n=1 Tax=Marinobacter xiaoshiensis TaxID=3073652 RepID=A0ABU2HEK2_9GAMM|nr:type II toxin-antitoxin system YafQ family toxin [Marinobacter sp. F60267]MDS1309503.1 type II toxin-antitoxin system YafQ family toxin [Marinobacter sp. F60267]